MSSFISIDNVVYKYPDGFKAIDNISININKGEKVGLIGSNGAGKTTFLQLIIGALNLNSGSIILDDITLSKKNIKEIRKKVGYIFQDSDNQLFMNKVYEDISFGLRNMNLSSAEIKDRVSNISKYLDIEDILDKNIYKLSGGQKKLVAIAGILVMNPSLILMDEPSVALDPKARRKLINILKELDETILIASHDLDMILDVCDRVILIDNGKLVVDGVSKEILTNEDLLESSNLESPLSLYRDMGIL